MSREVLEDLEDIWERDNRSKQEFYIPPEPPPKTGWEAYFELIDNYGQYELQPSDTMKYISAKHALCYGDYTSITKEEFAALKRAISGASNEADRGMEYEKGKLIRRIMYDSESLGLGEYKYLSDKYGACYIATAVYGSYDAPEVCTLRLFRDNYLAKRGWGRSFIKIYYKYSPKLIRSIKKNNILNVFFRNLLDKFVAKISLKY